MRNYEDKLNETGKHHASAVPVEPKGRLNKILIYIKFILNGA